VSLVPDSLPHSLRIDDRVSTPSTEVLLLAATAPSANCPHCGTLSDRQHSHYRRTVADLPLQDRLVILRLVVRRFRCVNPGCSRAIFCERLPALLGSHARTTTRLTKVHRAIGFALGGEAGSRLADHLDMPASPDTLLRRVKTCPDELAPPPRYVGVDDWALRKGQRYGTIVIDLERGCVLDIFEGRDGSALAVWLKAHPGVEVITRDRWAAFAQAATDGAPQAQQVADRWHLLKNLREAVEQLLCRHATRARAALQETPEAATAATVPAAVPTEAAVSPLPIEAPPLPGPRTAKQQARQARRQERIRQYERVKELRIQGQSVRQIAREMGVSVKRVRRYLRSDQCPDWNPGRKMPTQMDAFAAPIDAWVEQGGTNAADLFRELVGLGFGGSYEAVRRYLGRRLGSTGRPGPRVGPVSPPKPPTPPSPSARKLSFEFIRRPEARKAEVQARLEKLRACEPLRQALDLAGEFAEMVRKRSGVTLEQWLAKVEACAELRNFATGLRSDQAAVAAALTEKWSNGPVEGQVNRLKVIKRQMYGRAGLPLLRARVRKAS